MIQEVGQGDPGPHWAAIKSNQGSQSSIRDPVSESEVEHARGKHWKSTSGLFIHVHTYAHAIHMKMYIYIQKYYMSPLNYF